jgi:hypothetical protein
MLQRNLLYTGITRGKRLVVLVGQKKVVAIAVRNASGRRRWSKLREWLGPTADERTDQGGIRYKVSHRFVWSADGKATNPAARDR